MFPSFQGEGQVFVLEVLDIDQVVFIFRCFCEAELGCFYANVLLYVEKQCYFLAQIFEVLFSGVILPELMIGSVSQEILDGLAAIVQIFFPVKFDNSPIFGKIKPISDKDEFVKEGIAFQFVAINVEIGVRQKQKLVIWIIG